MASAFLHQLRFGFATNCSSSHSVIWLPGARDEVSRLRGPQFDDEAPFILASREAKRPYLRLQLDGLGAHDADLEAALGPPPDGWVNGLSQWAGDPALLRQVAWWALREGVAVLGSGENAGHSSLSLWGHPEREQIDPADWGDFIVRWDPLGYWSLYSRHGGHRLRLSFSRDANPHVVPFRGTWPELADVKLTDRCARGCTYCSQDSRPDGAHASYESVKAVLASLAEARVFEVVFGGGEPTAHPDFFRILGEAQRLGLRAAFTTRSLDWLPKAEMAQVNWDAVSWAFSVDSAAEVHRAWRATEVVRRGRRGAGLSAIHVVMGTEASEPDALLDIAAACDQHRLTLVLLGFKASGRGKGRVPSSTAHWLETLSAGGPRSVSIDAKLAAEYEVELRRRGVPDWLYEVDDGRYSMHIDAVRGRCGPSSYCDEGDFFPLPQGPESIRRAFETLSTRLAASRRERALALEQVDALAAGDVARAVKLDAALECRCEVCFGTNGVEATDELERPRLVCATCRASRPP